MKRLQTYHVSQWRLKTSGRPRTRRAMAVVAGLLLVASAAHRMRKAAHRRVRRVVALALIAMVVPISPAQAEMVRDHAQQGINAAIKLFSHLVRASVKPEANIASQRIEDPQQRALQVAQFRLCPSHLSLYAAELYTLVPMALDSKGQAVHGVAMKWETSNAGVATVSSWGEVTALAPGQASITVHAGIAQANVAVAVQEGTHHPQSDAEYDFEYLNDCTALASPQVNMPSPLADETPEATAPEATAPYNVVGTPPYSPQEKAQNSMAATNNNLGSANFL